MKVLAADDSATVRLLLEASLARWGYDVVSACDGEDAWAALKTEDAPPLAILDWMMPKLDGIEICRRVRERDRGLPTYIILLTAKGRKEDIVAGLEAGANDYLTKPFDHDELRARVHVGKRVVELQNSLAAKIKELQQALSHINMLQGILPICMHCHKIRTDQESWQRLENYIEAHSEAQFSHSLCPECLEKYYPVPDEHAQI